MPVVVFVEVCGPLGSEQVERRELKGPQSVHRPAVSAISAGVAVDILGPARKVRGEIRNTGRGPCGQVLTCKCGTTCILRCAKRRCGGSSHRRILVAKQ